MERSLSEVGGLTVVAALRAVKVKIDVGSHSFKLPSMVGAFPAPAKRSPPVNGGGSIVSKGIGVGLG